VGQGVILEETFKSGVWAYPTHFGEISCITAMKCQAGGAIPVVTNYAALKETVQFGKKISVDEDDIYEQSVRDEFKKQLIEALKDEKWQEEIRPQMIKWARDKFGWDAVAKQWDTEFRSNYLKEAMDTILKQDKTLAKYMPVRMQEKYGIKPTY